MKRNHLKSGLIPSDPLPPTPRQVFSDTMRIFCVTFILVILPLDIIFRLSSSVAYMTKTEILFEVAGLVIFLALLSLAAALVAGAAAWLLKLPLRRHGTYLVQFMVTLAALLCLLRVVSRLTLLWLQGIGYPGIAGSIVLKTSLLALTLLAIILFRKRISARLSEEGRRFFKAAVACLILSIALVGFRAVTVPFQKPPVESQGTSSATYSPGKNNWNVILVSFDALRTRDMSLYGYRLRTTPHMEALAAKSFVFENMYANHNDTRPSVLSIFTSLYPWQHKVTNLSADIFLPEETRGNTLFRVLKEAGYQTAAICTNGSRGHPWANDLHHHIDHLPGDTYDPASFHISLLLQLGPLTPLIVGLKLRTHQILNEMWNLYHLFPAGNSRMVTSPYPAEHLFGKARSYLKDARSPFFLWIHVFLPHNPYLAAKGYMYRFLPEKILDNARAQRWAHHAFWYKPEDQPKIDTLRLRYDEAILNGDGELGRFLDELGADGRLKNTLLVVASDHGESFERGYGSHSGPFLYQSLVHVPLIIRLPGQGTGKKVRTNAEHVDLAPTILSLLGIPAPPWMEGESLVPAMNTDTLTSKPKFTMNIGGSGRDEALTLSPVAVIQGEHKYIYNAGRGEDELYHLAGDPDEKDNLLDKEPERAASLKKLMFERVPIDRPR